jgi:hypothetical protein
MEELVELSLDKIASLPPPGPVEYRIIVEIPDVLDEPIYELHEKPPVRP